MSMDSSLLSSLAIIFVAALCLAAGTSAQPPKDITGFNATVGKEDGNDFKSISEAIQQAPEFQKARYYILVKAGVYNERVEVLNSKTNIALVGEDPATTIITFNRSANPSGIPTSDTATLSVRGEGFVGWNLTVINSAGFNAGQAVAVLNEANHSVFYKSIIMGYQDTLCAFQNYQFYKDCDIYGTVDFIFGAAKAVFQDCRLYAHAVSSDITVTAQSRESSAMDSGYSFQKCNVTVAPELAQDKPKIKAYLGRPWRDHATVIFMQSYLDDIVYPEGWSAWSDSSPVDNVFYAEFSNWGPGADTSQRIKWPHFMNITDPEVARQFTVKIFIDGDAWIPETGVPYDSDLGV